MRSQVEDVVRKIATDEAGGEASVPSRNSHFFKSLVCLNQAENQLRSTSAEMRKCESSAKRTRINCGCRRLPPSRQSVYPRSAWWGRIRPTMDVEATVRKDARFLRWESRNKERRKRRSNTNSVTFPTFDCLDAALETNIV